MGFRADLPWVVVGPGETFGTTTPPVRLVMFEPRAEAAAAMRAKFPSAEVIEAACGSEFGDADLYVYNGGVSSSLHPIHESARRVWNRPFKLEGTRQVKVIRLSDWCREAGLDQIGLLMTDAQGMDLAILQDMRPWLERKAIDGVMYECEDGYRHYEGPDNSRATAHEFMVSMGYWFMGYEGRWPAMNMVWSATEGNG